MEYSAVLIIPTTLKPMGDAVAQAMGWGFVAYSIPLSTDGETVTHYACRADVSPQFMRWIKGDDPLPDPSIAPVINALIYDFSPDPRDPEGPRLWGRNHLDTVLSARGLIEVRDAAQAVIDATPADVKTFTG